MGTLNINNVKSLAGVNKQVDQILDTTYGALGVSNFMHIQDKRVDGTNGGSSVAGEQVRVLNTITENAIVGASLLNNQITLPAGAYLIEGVAPAYGHNQHRVYLRDAGSTSVAIMGQTGHAPSAADVLAVASFSGVITINVVTVFEVMHYIQTGKATNGLGLASASAIASDEIYTDVKIWKVG